MIAGVNHSGSFRVLSSARVDVTSELVGSMNVFVGSNAQLRLLRGGSLSLHSCDRDEEFSRSSLTVVVQGIFEVSPGALVESDELVSSNRS
jgi:hypothetical protein